MALPGTVVRFSFTLHCDACDADVCVFYGVKADGGASVQGDMARAAKLHAEGPPHTPEAPAKLRLRIGVAKD